jgi:EF hand
MKAIAIFALGFAIAATATVTYAQASQPAVGKPARHARIDTNGDGVIDRSEAAANPKMAEHFDRLDANKDGRITAEERPQHGGKAGGQRGERIAQLDTNKDGRFSRDELVGKERALQNFAAIDANKDGFLTREEMAAHHKAHRRERGTQPQQK